MVQFSVFFQYRQKTTQFTQELTQWQEKQTQFTPELT